VCIAELHDSSLAVQQVGTLAAHGTPRTPEDVSKRH
jgi:hypothetical protein